MPKKCAFPDDFLLTPPRLAYAESKGVDNPEDTLEHFRDYHLAHGSTMACWDAAWRTWCRNAVRFGAPRRAGVVQPEAPRFTRANQTAINALEASNRRTAELIRVRDERQRKLLPGSE